MKEPLWKMVLAWGCVIMFFALPLTFFTVHLLLLNDFSAHTNEFKYLSEFSRTLTAVVVSLAGFNTVEMFRPVKHTS